MLSYSNSLVYLVFLIVCLIGTVFGNGLDVKDGKRRIHIYCCSSSPSTTCLSNTALTILQLKPILFLVPRSLIGSLNVHWVGLLVIKSLCPLRLTLCILDYSDPESPKITVFARHLVPVGKEAQMKTMPFFLYLQVNRVGWWWIQCYGILIWCAKGGPGFEVSLPSDGNSGWIKTAFDNGYQVL